MKAFKLRLKSSKTYYEYLFIWIHKIVGHLSEQLAKPNKPA